MLNHIINTVDLFDVNNHKHRKIAYLCEDYPELFTMIVKENKLTDDTLSLEAILENIATDYDDAHNTSKTYPYREVIYNTIRSILKS